MTTASSLTTPLHERLADEVRRQGGWIGFDTFMSLALYAPGLGYYTSGKRIFGTMPRVAGGQGSDFVTAPEISPFFGRTLAKQVSEALSSTQTTEVWEFGAGSGALAAQLLGTLGDQVSVYTIVDLSGSLKTVQQQTLDAYASKVRWADALPPRLSGVVVGNEVLDAMPVKLLTRINGVWHERGVALDPSPDADGGFVWRDQPTKLRPPVEVEEGNASPEYLTELHPQAEAFVKTIGERLTQGAMFLIDYGFPEAEYYHPQRHMGTVMCHRAHLADSNPLADVGLKDITAHVNFTGIALAAQEIADFGVLGYTSQARFLMNCGLLNLLDAASTQERAMAQKLVMEHEMGELFKVMGFCKGKPWEAMGFSRGDRSHTL